MAGAGVRDILLDGPWRHRDIAANGIRFHVALGSSSVLAARSSCYTDLVSSGGHGATNYRRWMRPALAQPPWTCGYGASDKTPRGYDPQTTALDVTGVIKSLKPTRRGGA